MENREKVKSPMPVKDKKLDYIFRAISEGKDVWVRGWELTANDLREMRGMTPSQIRRKQIGMRLVKS
mgnify:CR=1 FL=1|jgi:hypothetical protein